VTGHVSPVRSYGLGLLLALALVRGVIYAVVTPPWQAPDETGHFEYVWLMAHLGRLPHAEDLSPAFEQELVGSLYEWRYGEFIGRPLPEGIPARLSDLPRAIHARRSRVILWERFSISYLWQVLFLLPFRAHDLVTQLYAARFSSILLNIAIIWLAYKTFTELVPALPYLAWAMTAVLVFWPQHTFINSMVGDGTLAELMACVVLYSWVRLFRHGIEVWTVTGIVLGALAALLSKTTATFLLPLGIGLALAWALRRLRRPARWRYLAYAGFGAAMLSVVAWIWLQSPLGSAVLVKLQEESFPLDLVWIDVRGMTLGQALLVSHDSFWAYFGWMVVPVSQRWYGAVLLLAGLAAWGWLLGRDESHEVPARSATLMAASFVLACGIFVWVALVNTHSGYYQFQGRYLFPVIVPALFLLVAGWARLVPLRSQRLLLGAGIVFLVMFDAWSVLLYIIPYFYG